MNSSPPKLTLSQRKRLDILAAARCEFLESGFRDTSMDRVAERAQVSKRTVYNHFPSKEELFLAIASQFVLEMQQAITVAYDPASPLDEQLRGIANREVAQVTAEEYVAIFRVFLSEISNFEGLFDQVMAQAGGGHDPVADWIASAAEDRKLKVINPQLASSQFVSMIKGALFWPLVAGYGTPASKEEQQAVIEGAVAMFLDHYQS